MLQLDTHEGDVIIKCRGDVCYVRPAVRDGDQGEFSSLVGARRCSRAEAKAVAAQILQPGCRILLLDQDSGETTEL